MMFIALVELMVRLLLTNPNATFDCPALIEACMTDSECESLEELCADYLPAEE